MSQLLDDIAAAMRSVARFTPAVGMACSPGFHCLVLQVAGEFCVPVLIDPRMDDAAAHVFYDWGEWVKRCAEQSEWDARQ